MEKMIAFCGLICSECPVYIATKTDDTQMQEQLAKDYSTDSCKFEKEDMICSGCHSADGANEKMCVECPMRKCGIEKSVAHCAACAQYPCQYIKDYVQVGSSNRTVLEELVRR